MRSETKLSTTLKAAMKKYCAGSSYKDIFRLIVERDIKFKLTDYDHLVNQMFISAKRRENGIVPNQGGGEFEVERIEVKTETENSLTVQLFNWTGAWSRALELWKIKSDELIEITSKLNQFSKINLFVTKSYKKLNDKILERLAYCECMFEDASESDRIDEKDMIPIDKLDEVFCGSIPKEELISETRNGKTGLSDNIIPDKQTDSKVSFDNTEKIIWHGNQAQIESLFEYFIKNKFVDENWKTYIPLHFKEDFGKPKLFDTPQYSEALRPALGHRIIWRKNKTWFAGIFKHLSLVNLINRNWRVTVHPHFLDEYGEPFKNLHQLADEKSGKFETFMNHIREDFKGVLK